MIKRIKLPSLSIRVMKVLRVAIIATSFLLPLLTRTLPAGALIKSGSNLGGASSTSSNSGAPSGLQSCNPGSSNFLAFPTWYEYLPGNVTPTGCQPSLSSITDIWLIVAAVIDILLRIGAIVAVGMVIYGGIMYTISSGNPENVNKAKTIIINSLIGLAISITATAVITFIAGSIH